MRWSLASWLVLACAAGSAAPGAPGDGDKAADVVPLSLGRGEVAELHATAAGKYAARLETPAGDEQFVLILVSTRLSPEPAPFDYTLSLGGEVVGARPQLVTGCSLGGDRWKNARLQTEPPPKGAAPEVGSTRRMSLLAPRGVVDIGARVVATGEHSVIWVDGAHETSLDAAFAKQFLDDFERVILPRSRQIFGTEPDIDGDGRIQLVFSSLTHERGVAFFTGCDLEPALDGCKASNRGEYLYLTPPEAIDPPYNTPNAIKEILTHELAHLLHFNRKTLRNRLGEWVDAVFLSEGIGALAQDVVGYQAGNLYVTKAGLDGIDEFSLASVLDADEREAGVHGVLRGGAYLFARYLYDRAGGDAAHGLDIENRGGPALWRALMDAPEPIARALPSVTGAEAGHLAADFYTALALSGREQVGGVAPANPCFAFLPTEMDPITQKQRGTSPFARFHGTQMTGPALGAAHSPDGKLRGGGVEYLALSAAKGEPHVSFSLDIDPDAASRVRIGRLQ